MRNIGRPQAKSKILFEKHLKPNNNNNNNKKTKGKV
jgi:hypothetical protein